MLVFFDLVFASNASAEVLFILGGVFLGSLFALWWFIKSCLIICSPNEVIVVSGANRRIDLTKGYRIIRQGRVFKKPLVEDAHRMSLAPLSLSFSPYQLKTQDGCLLDVEINAHIKIAPEMPLLARAIERFLGQDVEEIRRAAQWTIEGHLGDEIAAHTLQQLEKEGASFFAKRLRDGIESDLARFGLCLDTFSFPRFAVKEKT